MITSRSRHCWAVSGVAAATQAALPLPPEPHVEVRCHRRLRGPYTGLGELLRTVVPELMAQHADLVLPRAIDLVAIAPELAEILPLPDKTLTEAAGPQERTRYYAADRTARLAHGAVELLLDWARVKHADGAVIAFTEVAEADPTDHELLRILLRRCPPQVLTVIVEWGREAGEPVDEQLAAALHHDAVRTAACPRTPPTAPQGADLAQWFIDSDGTSADPDARAAYDALPEPERARRHSARAELLAARDEPSLRLGAIPYHMERGRNPMSEVGDVFFAATMTCQEKGYYHAAMDLALRGRRCITPEAQPSVYWNLTTKVGACHAFLGDAEGARRYYDKLRRSTYAEMHMRAAYMIAMIYTRYLPKDAQDHERALEWANTSIVIADNHPKPEWRVINGAFMRNGRALVELHRGNLQGALELVNEAIALADGRLGEDEQLLHRSVLLNNRARIRSALGDRAGALDDYDEVIRRDPNYGEYYFDRATVRRAAGMDDAALADYAEAIRLSPPFYEAHYNRADLLRELGDDEAALRDLDYALELEPDHLDSLVNRADLLLASGDVERAAEDVERGLTLEPGNARLLTARASMQADAEDYTAAWATYSAALAEDPALVAAWANRAVLAYLTERPDRAVDDLTEAIRLADDAALRANRAIALQALGEHRRAVEDLDAALLAGADDPDLLYRRGASRHVLGDRVGARTDWRAHLAAYGSEPSPFVNEIRFAAPDLVAQAVLPETVA